jgi:hypothetical protein
MVPAERGQCGIGQPYAVCDELLVHAHQISFAGVVQREDLLAVRLGALAARQRRWLRRARGQHALDRAARDAQGGGDGACAMAGLMEFEDGCPGRLVQHG